MRQLRRFQDHIRELEAGERLEQAVVHAFPHLVPHERHALHARWLAEAGGQPLLDDPSGSRVRWDRVRAFVGAPNP